MYFIVELQFRDSISFETHLQADDELSAKRKALAQAKENGFGNNVKKCIIIVCRKVPEKSIETEV